ncbi:MAG TPA: hypothetical protein VND91_04775 [Candidatus Saccharimonadia bacterium]|nr:hypothetical protein [Candidatus Saccharimonadia bacterium]
MRAGRCGTRDCDVRGRARIVYAWLFASLLGSAAAQVSAQRLDAAALAGGASWQSLPLSALLGGPKLDALEFAVRIPAMYRRYEPSDSFDETHVWCKPSDWSRLRRSKPHSGRYGAFVAQRSNLITWDRRRALFRDGAGRDERNLAQRFERLKAQNVRIERIDAHGVPMLLLEADIKPTERLRVVYVAAPETTRMLYYLPQRPWSDADAAVWAAVRDAVIAARGTSR